MSLIAKYGPARSIALLVALLLSASCSTVTTRPAAAGASAPMNAAFAAAEDLARRDASLSGQARDDNRMQIDHLLAGIDDATLSRQAAALPVGDPLYNFAGRALLNRGLSLPRPFDQAGMGFGASNRPPADSDGYRPPLKLGVLLPLSGELSKASVPVQDGLLTAYYAERRRRPEIKFYDTAGTPAGAVAAYARAVTDGVDFIAGPLGRDEVSAVFAQKLTVPMLALNRGTVAPPAGSVSFSLAPEDDGINAAEFVVSHHAHSVLVLKDNSYNRTVAAFRTQLQSRGGTVTDTIAIADKPGDVHEALQAAALKPAGVDAVLLAVNPAQARALAPQLGAAGLATKLRVMPSSVIASSSADRALDGVDFPSEAWGLRSVPGLPAPETAARTLPSVRGGGARLFAFGHDAWLLTAYLEQLATHADGSVQGATGTLHLDGFGNIVRTPAWSTFNGATAVPLGDSAGHGAGDR
jgi:outer membrane PBP1 activator LpoA protein